MYIFFSFFVEGIYDWFSLKGFEVDLVCDICMIFDILIGWDVDVGGV